MEWGNWVPGLLTLAGWAGGAVLIVTAMREQINMLAASLRDLKEELRGMRGELHGVSAEVRNRVTDLQTRVAYLEGRGGRAVVK